MKKQCNKPTAKAITIERECLRFIVVWGICSILKQDAMDSIHNLLQLAKFTNIKITRHFGGLFRHQSGEGRHRHRFVDRLLDQLVKQRVA